MTLGDLHESPTGIDVAHAAEAERTRLRAEAADLGGPSPLVTYRDAVGLKPFKSSDDQMETNA